MSTSEIISGYIKESPQEVQTLLQQVYQAIKETVPDAEETISYGLPTFKVKSKNLVHFGGFKNHIGFYPTPGGITEFQEELSHYKGAKGSVQFPLDQPMPFDLIKKIVLFRLHQVSETQKKK